MSTQPPWLSAKKPAHLSLVPKKPTFKPRQPSNISFNGVMWTTLFLTFGVFIVFT